MLYYVHVHLYNGYIYVYVCALLCVDSCYFCSSVLQSNMYMISESLTG